VLFVVVFVVVCVESFTGGAEPAATLTDGWPVVTGCEEATVLFALDTWS
jgi:hypothetical protein